MDQPQNRRQFWWMHCQRCRELGMTLKAYAAQEGLTLSVLYGWSKRFRREQTAGSAFRPPASTTHTRMRVLARLRARVMPAAPPPMMARSASMVVRSGKSLASVNMLADLLEFARDGRRVNVVVHTQPVYDDNNEITAVMEIAIGCRMAITVRTTWSMTSRS